MKPLYLLSIKRWLFEFFKHIREKAILLADIFQLYKYQSPKFTNVFNARTKATRQWEIQVRENFDWQ